MLITALTVIGQLHRVSRAQNQLCAKQPLQRLKPSTYRRTGRIHLYRGGGERPGLHDTNERTHQFDTIYTLLLLHLYFAYTFSV